MTHSIRAEGRELLHMSEKMIVACPECHTRFVAPLEKFLPRGRKVRCAKCGHAWFQAIDDNSAGAAGDSTTLADVASDSTTTRVVPESDASPAESIMDRATRASAAPAAVQSGAALNQSVGLNEPQHDASAGSVGARDADTDNSIATEVDARKVAGNDKRARPPRRKRSWFPRFLFYTFAAALIAGALGYFFKDEISAKVPELDRPLTTWKRNVDAVVSKVIPEGRILRIDNVKYDINETGDETALLVTADVFNESDALKKAPKLKVTLFGADDAVLEELSLAPEDIEGEISADESAPYFLRMPYPPEDLERVEVDFAE